MGILLDCNMRPCEFRDHVIETKAWVFNSTQNETDAVMLARSMHPLFRSLRSSRRKIP